MSVRVAQVISTPAGMGGAEKVLIALADAAAQAGIDQIVLNPFTTEAERGPLGQQLSSLGIYEGFSATRKTQVPAVRAWVADRLRRFGADVVHVHLFHAAVLVATLRTPAARRLLTHHHGNRMRSERRTLDERLDRWAGRRYESIVAPANHVREFLISHYRYEPGRVEVIRNGWSGKPLPRRPPDHPEIVCVGNFRTSKGHIDLLDALSLLSEHVPAAHLTLIGDGPLEESLRRRCDELGIQGVVTFLGRVNDVWPYLANATLFVLPSIEETAGIALMEAMAAGLPTVGSDVGGIRDLIRETSAGILVPPRDPKAIADAMRRIIESPDLSSRLEQAGPRAVAGMTSGAMARGYLDLYERLRTA